MIKRDVTYIELNKYCWTEDNRLQGMSDKNNGAWYNYDATGERNLKLTGQTMHVNQNGQDYYTPIFDQQTLYANPLITINDKGYTKHYFEEGKRICSKIGSGGLIDIDGNMEGISQGIEEIRDIQKEGVVKTFDICMQIYPYIKTNNLYKTIVQPYEGQMNPEEPSFYYHSDHLGSASFLTDRDGKETQQLVYLPFGELRSNREYLNINNKYHEQHWVDMKYNTSQYDTPYKFNGKEKDEELRSNREYNNINNKYHEQTGYNNYGARYYYDWASIWLSVDPNSDNYPHATSYAYCNNNPIMLIDPDGKDWYYTEDGKCLGQDKAKTNYVWSVNNNQYRTDKDGVNWISGGTKLQDGEGNYIDHDQFAESASIINREGHSNKDECLWIAHTTNNEAQRNAESVYSLLTSGYSCASDGSKLSPQDNSSGAMFARAALINVFTGGADPTGGATLWDGTDFLAWGLNSPYGDKPHAKFRQYSSISISKDIYNSYLSSVPSRMSWRINGKRYYYNIPAPVFPANMSNSGFYYKTGYKGKGLEATGTKGQTVFWRTR